MVMTCAAEVIFDPRSRAEQYNVPEKAVERKVALTVTVLRVLAVMTVDNTGAAGSYDGAAVGERKKIQLYNYYDDKTNYFTSQTYQSL